MHRHVLGTLCVLLLASAPLSARELSLSALPDVSAATRWPGLDWERAPAGDAVAAAVSDAIDFYFSDTYRRAQGEPRALVVVQAGRIVGERYDAAHSCDQLAWTGSVAKMMGAVMAGLLAQQGMLDVQAPAPVPAWRSDDSDPRASITTHHILTMTAGLDWDDAYATSGLSILKTDFMEMAFGEGHTDSAAFTVGKPLAYPPGSFYRYNDGLPSVMGAIASTTLGGSRNTVRDFVSEALFAPLQMRNTRLEFDLAGNWYGASGVRWSPCDLARFGYLLLRGGFWRDSQLLPVGWVDYMRTPTDASLKPSLSRSRTVGYGANTATYVHPDDPLLIDDFGHLGWGGSYLRVVPSLDLVIALFGANGGSGAGLGGRAVFDQAVEALIDSVR